MQIVVIHKNYGKKWGEEMKKIVVSVVVVFLLFGSVVYAAANHGKFEGYNIVKMKSDGKELAVEDTPAINFKGRTMVPIYMLRQLGVEVTWNADEYSVDVKIPATKEDVDWFKFAIRTMDQLNEFRMLYNDLSSIYEDLHISLLQMNANWSSPFTNTENSISDAKDRLAKLKGAVGNVKEENEALYESYESMFDYMDSAIKNYENSLSSLKSYYVTINQQDFENYLLYRESAYWDYLLPVQDEIDLLYDGFLKISQTF